MSTATRVLTELARRGTEGITSEEVAGIAGITVKSGSKLLAELRRSGKIEKIPRRRNWCFVHVLAGVTPAPVRAKSSKRRIRHGGGRCGKLPQSAYVSDLLPPELERAIRALRRDGFPVHPLRGGQWAVGTVTVDAAEMLARAERAERRRGA